MEGSQAKIETVYDWEKKTATSREDYSGTAFTEGTYRYVTQVRIEGTGATTHVLDKNGITVTVNDVKWDSGIPDIYDTYSFAWISSKEYTVTAPAGTPLDFVKDKKWDIDSNYINQTITAFSVADGAVGGTKPYTFSKVSGPEWIDVATDGTVSGTPTALGANADLVIKVTDSAAEHATKEITLRVGNTYVLPADREVINVIRANSNIAEISAMANPYLPLRSLLRKARRQIFTAPRVTGIRKKERIGKNTQKRRLRKEFTCIVTSFASMTNTECLTY